MIEGKRCPVHETKASMYIWEGGKAPRRMPATFCRHNGSIPREKKNDGRIILEYFWIVSTFVGKPERLQPLTYQGLKGVLAGCLSNLPSSTNSSVLLGT